MGTKEIVIGIEKRYANLQITKKVAKFIKENKGKMKGKIDYKDITYSQDSYNNYYTFKVKTALPLDGAAEYIRTTIGNVVKKVNVIPFTSSKRELTSESNILRFTQFKSKYIDKIDS